MILLQIQIIPSPIWIHFGMFCIGIGFCWSPKPRSHRRPQARHWVTEIRAPPGLPGSWHPASRRRSTWDVVWTSIQALSQGGPNLLSLPQLLDSCRWLVVEYTNPSEKWWSESQLGWWNSQYMEKKNVPNHQPARILSLTLSPLFIGKANIWTPLEMFRTATGFSGFNFSSVKFTNLENQVSLLSAKETLTSHLPHCRYKYDTEARSPGVTWVRIHLKCKMSWLKKGRNFLHVWKVCFSHSC